MTTTDANAATTRGEGRDNPNALTIELSPGLRQRIKAAAAQRGVSVQAYIEEVLQHTVPQASGTETPAVAPGRSLAEILDPFRETREATLQTTGGRLLDDEEEKDQTERNAPSLEWYKQLISLRERLAQAYPGKVFEDSTEIIRQMREERSEELDKR